VTCPYCQTETVEVARKAWFLTGFVLAARYGTRHFVGCRGCVNNQLRKTLFATALGGWWSIPWGLATPIVIVQNLWQFSDKPSDDELERLKNAGVANSQPRPRSRA
jgi:hypothetical protein